MRILVTGATGFIGGHIFRDLSRLGHELIAWSRQTKAPTNLKRFGTYQCVDLLREAPKISVDLCIHCAGYASDEGSLSLFRKNNLDTTKNLFRAVEAPSWINLSSASVYAIRDKIWTEDDVDLNNIPAHYGRSKYEAELHLNEQLATYQSLVHLRPRGVYGTNDRVLLPRILAFGKKKKIKIPNGGKVRLSMTSIKNLLQMVRLCLDNTQAGVRVYNVADKEAYLLHDIFHELNAGYHGKKIEISSLSPIFVKQLIRATSLFTKPFPMTMQAFEYITTPTIIDISKAERELSYIPQTSFFDEVESITNWARSIDSEMIFSKDKQLGWAKVLE